MHRLRLAILSSITFLAVCTSTSAQQKKWTPPPAIQLETLIQKDPSAAAKLIRSSWGEKSLKGKAFVMEKTTALWARQSETPVKVVKTNGEVVGEMTKLDDKGLQALALTLKNGDAYEYQLIADGKAISKGNVKVEYYDYQPNSLRKDGVPQGTVTRHTWTDSKVFPNTVREYEVYIPAQYDGSKLAALMVFQDGLRHADPNGPLRAPIVYDNLIAQGKMPVTIGIFINPGRLTKQAEGAKPANRSLEYDSLGPDYSKFLLEEIIPAVVKEHNLKLSDDPKMWGVAGGSSGCACAWTVAWERPDKFGKVLGWVGTFVDIRGAHNYPPLVRKNDRKPIRAALLGERNDLDNQFGNWPLANQQMEKALTFKDYDYRYWWGDGFHGSRHAGAMLPEMLEWLWSDVTK